MQPLEHPESGQLGIRPERVRPALNAQGTNPIEWILLALLALMSGSTRPPPHWPRRLPLLEGRSRLLTRSAGPLPTPPRRHLDLEEWPISLLIS